MSDIAILQAAIIDMREEEALELTRHLLDRGVDPVAVFNAYQEAMTEIGRRFECNEYFIPELIMSGEIMSAASDIIKPRMAGQEAKERKAIGTMVLATVEGDIHDIGKNIAGMIYDLNGIRVVDLGVDIPASRIIAAAKEERAEIVGLSGLLTLAFDPMRDVVEKLKAEGLREGVKVIIGGGQMDAQIQGYVGADAFATDAIAGLNVCKKWLAA